MFASDSPCKSFSSIFSVLMALFRPIRELFEQSFRRQQSRILQFFAGQWSGFVSGMIAIERVVPAFDVEIGIIAHAQQRVHDFRPVGLAETGEAMLSDTGMADAIGLQ